MIIFTHISLALLIASLIQIQNQPLAVLILVIGAMLPDADYPFSFIGRLLQPFSFKLHEKFGHRTITHSIIPLLVLAVIYFATKEILVIYLLIGMASHIILDMFTIQGVKLLYPLWTNFILLDGSIETNSKADWTFALILDLIIILVNIFSLNILNLIN